MSASKLTETVSDAECKTHLEAQDRVNQETALGMAKILTALHGEPGDTSKPGLSGGYIRMCDKIDSCNAKLDALTKGMVLFATNERVDTVEKTVNDVMKEAKKTQWSKLIITSLSTAVACLTLAAAACGLMMKKFDAMIAEVHATKVIHEQPTKTHTPSRPDW